MKSQQLENYFFCFEPNRPHCQLRGACQGMR